MKFINTKRFSPVIYEGDVPHERDLFWIDPMLIPRSKEAYSRFIKENNIVIDKAWWKRQRKRCLTGYTVKDAVIFGEGDVFVDGLNVIKIDDNIHEIPHLGIKIHGNDITITERHYLYLNFWKIQRLDKNVNRKIVGNPLFTDLSFENWWIRKRMLDEHKDNFWAKRRQCGASEESAADLAYDMMFYNDVQLAIVGGQDTYNERTFMMVKRGLNLMYNTQFYKELAINTKDLIYTRYTNCQLHSKTAKDNAQILSGLTPYKTILEEIGIMPAGLVKDIAEFIKPSLYAQGQKVGYLNYVGTGGEADEGVEDMEDMFYHPDKYDLLDFPNIHEDNKTQKVAYFIPGWKFEIIDDDGNSLKKESLKNIEDEGAKKTPEQRFQYNILKPIKPSDMFNIKAGGFFGEQIAEWCNMRRAYINNHREERFLERGDLNWRNKRKPWEGCEWIPNPNGVFIVAEKPRINKITNLAVEDVYKGGTDSYDQDEAKTSKSKLSSSIFKTFDPTEDISTAKFTNTFVASYLDRPGINQGGKELAYENSAKLHVWYSAPNLVEYSKLFIFNWFEDNGLAGFLKMRPDFAMANMIEKSQVSNKYGLHGSLIVYALKLFRDYLSDMENVLKCYLPEHLYAWAKYKISKNYNCDITISDTLAYVNAKNDVLELEESNSEETAYHKVFKGYKKINGKLEPVYLYQK